MFFYFNLYITFLLESSITKWDIKNTSFTYQYDVTDLSYFDIQFFLLKYLQ